MIREIKFRAWHRERKQMYWFDIMWGNFYPVGSGYIGMCPFGVKRKQINFLTDNREEIDPHDCELMQYTGLKDKNRVEIYEGDIVKRVDGGLRWVRWSQKGFELYDLHISNRYWNSDADQWKQSEVIANIYENPELLEAT